MVTVFLLAHKFAEWDNGDDYELHEPGIFYSSEKHL